MRRSEGETAYAALLAEYDQKRKRAERAAAEKASELEKLPGFAALAQRERKAVVLFAKKALENPENSDNLRHELSEVRKELSLEREKLLRDAGIDLKWLEPQYECPSCNDTGFCGDPVKQPCKCLRQKLLEQALLGAHLDENVSFEKFDLSVFPDAPIDGREETQRGYMERVRGFAQRYAERFPDNPKPNVLLYGPPGLGKSYLLGCMVRRILERGHNAILLTAYALQDIVLRERLQNQNTLALAPYLNVDLLAIDDLGGEPSIRNVSGESFFSLLNERSRAKRATLIATNIASNELADRYGQRISSRLLDRKNTTLLWLRGKDLR